MLLKRFICFLFGCRRPKGHHVRCLKRDTIWAWPCLRCGRVNLEVACD